MAHAMHKDFERWYFLLELHWPNTIGDTISTTQNQTREVDEMNVNASMVELNVYTAPCNTWKPQQMMTQELDPQKAVIQLAYVSLAVWTAEMMSVNASQPRMPTPCIQSVQHCILLIDVRLWRRTCTKLVNFPALCLVLRLADCSRCRLFSAPPVSLNQFINSLIHYVNNTTITTWHLAQSRPLLDHIKTRSVPQTASTNNVHIADCRTSTAADVHTVCKASSHGVAALMTHSSSSSSGGASLTGHSCLHEFAPLGTVLRTLPGGVDSEIMLLKVELNHSKITESLIFSMQIKGVSQ